ncbi:MAG: S26 family signal peptidase [Lentisphaerota bacterium]
MNCPHCGIFNLPHVVACVKCGTALYATLPDNFNPEPPRARHKRHLLHWLYRWRRHRGFSLNDGVAYTGAASTVLKAVERVLPGTPAFIGARSEPAAVVRGTIGNLLNGIRAFPGWLFLLFLLGIVLPGLPQILLNRRIRGWVMLIVYFIALLGVFICFGYWMFAWFVTAVTLCSTTSACDVANLPAVSFTRRLITNLVLSMVTFFLISGVWQYGGNLFMRSYVPVFQATEYSQMPGVLAGDIVQGRVQKKYSAGDVVAFNAYSAVAAGEGNYRRTQLSIDRVLATPGQKVDVRGNRIFINDSLIPSEVRPLNSGYAIPDMKLTLGNNQYLLCPSNFARPLAGRFAGRTDIQRLMHIVEDDRILYRPDKVILPWWRRHLLTAEIK